MSEPPSRSDETEYWKSQARKYCEFCKCWFADNKVSISFHENGKRHKEAVQKHISQLTKKSTKDAKQKDKVDDEMKKMEEAAMVAYLKDVQNNADLTSKNINEMLGQSASSSGTSNDKSNIISGSVKTTKAPPAWQEVKNEDGSTYFWNTKTNDTTWDPPDEYVSLAQQEEQKLKGAENKKKQEKLKKQKQKECFKEAKAFVAREQMRELSSKAPEPSAASGAVEFGPAPRAARPYGSWTPVVNEPVEKIDLQLPKTNKEVIPPPVVVTPEVIKFGEKRVESLGEGPVEFKRRKFGNAKRNMRQKLDDD